jgi:hypothetical protein
MRDGNMKGTWRCIYLRSNQTFLPGQAVDNMQDSLRTDYIACQQYIRNLKRYINLEAAQLQQPGSSTAHGDIR